METTPNVSYVTLPEGGSAIVPNYKDSNWYKKQKEKQMEEWKKNGGKLKPRLTCECGADIQTATYDSHINTTTHSLKMKLKYKT
jgi:hypothetical protein